MALNGTRRGQATHEELTLCVGRHIQPAYRTSFCRGLAGIADHRPQFSVRQFSAELEFDPDVLEGGALHLVAKTASLEIMDEVSQEDRKVIEAVIGEILHPQRYPDVAFHSSRVVCARVDQKPLSCRSAGDGKASRRGKCADDTGANDPDRRQLAGPRRIPPSAKRLWPYHRFGGRWNASHQRRTQVHVLSRCQETERSLDVSRRS
jgi:hypothetical protein